MNKNDPILGLYILLYTIVSLFLLVVVYFINKGASLEISMEHNSYYYCTFLVLMFCYWLFSWLLTKGFKYLAIDYLLSSDIENIEAADATFVPMYFAYIFIGLSIQSFTSLLLCYLLLVMICYCAQTYYFNPLYYLFGYKYYFVTNSVKQKLLIMSRRRIPLGAKINFNSLARINDFTYIDIEK